jgi:hypothetical protein
MSNEPTTTNAARDAGQTTQSTQPRKFRWDGTVRTVHQTGDVLSASKGVNVELHLDGDHCHAEVYSDDQEEYADIGLAFDGNVLVDYDGVFDLPPHVAALLLVNGYDLGDMVDQDDAKFMAEVATYRAEVEISLLPTDEQKHSALAKWNRECMDVDRTNENMTTLMARHGIRIVHETLSDESIVWGVCFNGRDISCPTEANARLLAQAFAVAIRNYAV